MRKRSFSRPSSPRSGGQFRRNGRVVNFNSRPKRGPAAIDPQRFINKAIAPVEQEVYVPHHQFTDFAFTEGLKANIIKRGFTAPTPIQDKSITPVLEGRDLIGLANTGTGKTAAFLLPLIDHMQRRNGRGTVLIVVPTRELAVQIDDEFREFGKGLRLYSALCVGGASMNRQIEQLRRRPQFVIGTPGRLKDLVQQRVLKLEHTKALVLDEADRMLDMGFINDIEFLMSKLPEERQSLCFSATLSPEIERLVHRLLKDPVTVSVRTAETSQNVDQDIVRAGSKEEKLELLIDLLKQEDFDKVLVFGQTKWGVQRLADTLKKHDIVAEAIHGDKSQPQRQKALRAFKNNQAKVLVATDVAARGLDIPNVSHVINFDQPNNYDDYIHRIGRTGRGGKAGKALTFVAH